jgi:ATP-dependent exoDNAse (exonuclease V) beta subunit
MKNIKFINAGAGSGKTHRLTEILADWIKEGNQANKVLLTTFTKKAAAEIKERAQSKLLIENEFVQANKLQAAFIGTVHSVGYQFIKKYWYLLGISPELKEISEIEKDVYFSFAIGEVPTEEELTRLDELCFHFDFRDNNNFFNPRAWKEDVQVVMNASLLNNIESIHQSLNISIEKINTLFKGNLSNEKVKPLLLKLKDILNNEGIAGREAAQNESDNLLSYEGEIDLSYFLKVCKLIDRLQIVYPDGKTKKYENVRGLFPVENIQDFEIFKNSVLEYLELIFSISERSLEMYSNFKQEKGLVDFTDMEVYFLKILDNKIVQNEIRETIEMVMVDEFQDSNPIQLSIFMKLSQLVKQSYWVGDPKQAIYAFRGSDPVLIDQIIKEFTKQNENGLSIDLLKMSWRSVPELVSLSNQIFEERMLEQSSDIHLESITQIHGPNKKEADNNARVILFNNWIENIEIHPLKKKDTIGLLPARSSSDELNGSPIKFWNFLNYGSKGSLKAAAANAYFQKLAQKTATIIEQGEKGEFKVIDKETGKSRDIVGSDICFLVSSNKKVSDLSQEFQKLGYPVNAFVEGLTDTVEYRILQNIITLFIDKNNALSSTELAYLTGENSSVSILLEERISLLTLSLKLQQEDDEFDFSEALNDWLNDSNHKNCILELRKQSSHLSVSYTLQKITNQFNIFQKLLNFNNADLRQANVLKLCKLAKEYETYCINMNLGSGLVGFLNFVESNKEYNVQAANNNKNAVNIMTYHKSKGLEWPMVILSDLSKDPLDKFHMYETFSTKIVNNSELNISNPLEDRSVEFSFWPFGTSSSVNEALTEKIETSLVHIENKTNKLNEASRLMYVGITRARDYLIFATNQYQNATWLEDVVRVETRIL